MAMAVEGTNRHDQAGEYSAVTSTTWHKSTATAQGAEAEIQHLIEATPRVIEAVSQQLPAEFPPLVADAIFSGLTASALTLSQGPAG